MKPLALIGLAFLCVGCSSIKRLTEGPQSTPAAQTTVSPNNYWLTGTTTKDYQSVYFTVKGFTVTVEVLRPGEATYSTLDASGWPTYNEYHVFTIPKQGVRFDHLRERFAGGGYAETNEPAAPTGTQYKIHVVKDEDISDTAVGADLDGKDWQPIIQ